MSDQLKSLAIAIRSGGFPANANRVAEAADELDRLQAEVAVANARIASLEAEVGFMRDIIGDSYKGDPRLIIIPIAGSFTEGEFLEALSNEIKHGLDPNAVIRAAEAAAKGGANVK